MAAAVVFDLDDSLYLEADYVRSGFNAVGEWCRHELNVESFEAAAWQLFLEGRRGDIFDAALTSLGISPPSGVIARMVTVYRTHPPHIALTADSVQCLEQLRGKCKLGLITDGPAEMQWNKIRALGLEKIFDHIIVTADLGPGFSKPHPRAFTEMEKSLQAGGPQVFYVADNPAKDFIVPSQLGWRTIRIIREGSLHQTAAGASVAELTLPDLGGLAALMGQRFETASYGGKE